MKIDEKRGDDKGEYENALNVVVQSFLIFAKLQSPNARIARDNIIKMREKMGDSAIEVPYFQSGGQVAIYRA
jgi:hypothetical protein